jgi:hypothetical protein
MKAESWRTFWLHFWYPTVYISCAAVSGRDPLPHPAPHSRLLAGYLFYAVVLRPTFTYNSYIWENYMQCMLHCREKGKANI